MGMPLLEAFHQTASLRARTEQESVQDPTPPTPGVAPPPSVAAMADWNRWNDMS
jgi:hypothetical protein